MVDVHYVRRTVECPAVHQHVFGLEDGEINGYHHNRNKSVVIGVAIY
jgi:hypothetical protein